MNRHSGCKLIWSGHGNGRSAKGTEVSYDFVPKGK